MQLVSRQIFCSEKYHVWSVLSNKELHLYLNNVVGEVSTLNKLHDKEEPLFGLEGSKEGSEESTALAKSKDFSLKEGDRGTLLA